MAEGGNAEKFPDEWDLQFLGNTIISQLSSGNPPDFLIKAPLLMVPTLGPLALTVPLSEEENLFSSLCKFNFSDWIFLQNCTH